MKSRHPAPMAWHLGERAGAAARHIPDRTPDHTLTRACELPVTDHPQGAVAIRTGERARCRMPAWGDPDQADVHRSVRVITVRRSLCDRELSPASRTLVAGDG